MLPNLLITPTCRSSSRRCRWMMYSRFRKTNIWSIRVLQCAGLTTRKCNKALRRAIPYRGKETRSIKLQTNSRITSISISARAPWIHQLIRWIWLKIWPSWRRTLCKSPKQELLAQDPSNYSIRSKMINSLLRRIWMHGQWEIRFRAAATSTIPRATWLQLPSHQATRITERTWTTERKHSREIMRLALHRIASIAAMCIRWAWWHRIIWVSRAQPTPERSEAWLQQAMSTQLPTLWLRWYTTKRRRTFLRLRSRMNSEDWRFVEQRLFNKKTERQFIFKRSSLEWMMQFRLKGEWIWLKQAKTVDLKWYLQTS